VEELLAECTSGWLAMLIAALIALAAAAFALIHRAYKRHRTPVYNLTRLYRERNAASVQPALRSPAAPESEFPPATVPATAPADDLAEAVSAVLETLEEHLPESTR
jgi:hypothetical protein